MNSSPERPLGEARRDPLRVAILSAGSKATSTPRLREELEARGHKVRVLSPGQLRIDLLDGSPSLVYRGRSLKSPDVVIPRIGASHTFFGVSLLAQFEQMGIPTLNSAQAIQTSRNKLRALQRLSRHGIGFPETIFLSGHADPLEAIDRVGGAPVIIKLLEGTQGVGVMLAESVHGARAILDTLRKTGQNVLLQRYVGESRGRDVRALVVGGRVLAAVRRTADGNEFRSNIHRGGSAKLIELPKEYEEAAIRAARVLELRLAGVDMLESDEGPLVVEVNSSPSIEGMEKATGVDLAGPIVDLVERVAHAKLRGLGKRLAITPEFGVVEWRVIPGGFWAGKTLEDAGFFGQSLKVLAVQRGPRVQRRPKRTQVLKPDDVVVALGEFKDLPEEPMPRGRRVSNDSFPAQPNGGAAEPGDDED